MPQIEKYCCGLPKEIRDYCTKTSVTNMTQLIENATTADALLRGKTSGYKNSTKDAKSGKPFKAEFVVEKRRKKPYANWQTPAERNTLMDAKKCFIASKKGTCLKNALKEAKRSC